LILDTFKLNCIYAASGLSIKQLSEKSGLSRHTVSALLRGARENPLGATVGKLCAALEVPAAEVIGGKIAAIIQIKRED